MSTNGADTNGRAGAPQTSATTSSSAAAPPIAGQRLAPPAGQRLDHHGKPVPDHYKWLALSNTTLGVLIATINASILNSPWLPTLRAERI